MQAWETFLAQQEKELGSDVVQKWLKPFKVLRFDAGNLFLEAKDYFQALWFEEHIRPKAQQKLVNNNNRRIKIHLSIANGMANGEKQKPLRKAGKEKKEQTPPPFQLNFDSLDPFAVFEHFIVMEGNHVPYKLMCETCGYDGQTRQLLPSLKEQAVYNPIYLYGPSGTGKTHLLNACTSVLRQRGLKTIYARAETFTEHVVSAIRAGEMSTFRQTYRNIDVLIIDDVHIFSRKGATQEELFHTFNTLHLAGKQIILSANCSPQELQLIEPRLISRFEWGIVVPLEPLQQTHMEQLVFAKSAFLNFALNAKIASFLTETFSSGAKALIKALEALILRLHLNEQKEQTLPLSVSLTKHYLADLISEEEKNAITPHKIIQTVAEFYGIRTDDILGESQSRECVIPRQIAMYLCRMKLKMPFMKIGSLFTRDHSTVMSSVKRICKEVEKGEKDVHASINSIVSKLQT